MPRSNRRSDVSRSSPSRLSAVKWHRGTHSVGGFSIPMIGGGLSWNTGEAEKDVVRQLVVRLSERRVLSEIYEAEYEAFTNQSLVDIRGWITDAMTRLVPGSEATLLLAALRDGCNHYLRLTPDPRVGAPLRPKYAEALQGLRETFRVILRYLATEGGIAEAGELAAAIPPSLSPSPGRMFLEGPGRSVRAVAPPPRVPSGRNAVPEGDSS